MNDRSIDVLINATASAEGSTLVSERPIAAANEAFRSASLHSRHLLVLLGPVSTDCETLRILTEGFDIDPYFGITVPRQIDRTTDRALRLTCEWGDPALPTLDRRVLAECPEYWILPEMLCSCFLLRDSVVANFDLLDETYETLAGALYDYLGRVRRCGFRCVVMNRAVAVAPTGSTCCQVTLPRIDARRLYTEHPDNGLARTELALHHCHTYESLLGRGFSSTPTLRKSLLIDARGLLTHVDGTSEAVLSTCDALYNIDHDWSIALLAAQGPSQFHGLTRRYPKWQIIAEPGDHYFTAALRLSQPWDVHCMVDLHRMALFNFYTMLDSIAWDVIYAAPRGLGGAWSFVSAFADGILYISEFTRERFSIRFPSARSTLGYVSHLSFRPSDYAPTICEAQPAQDLDYIFVVGNSYDHKDLGPTVDLLSSTFPFHSIKTLGLKSHSSPLVETLESGRVSQNQVDRLFAEASVVVFPSLYEGFGFPILKALSLGRTVLARHSALLLEIASHYRGPGRLVAFRDRVELVDAVGRILHGADVNEMRLGTDLADNAEPKGWQEVSAGILDFIEEQVKDIRRSRWMARQNVIEQFSAADLDRKAEL